MHDRAAALVGRMDRSLNAISASGSTDVRIDWLYRQLYSRSPYPEELAVARAFLQPPAGENQSGADDLWQQLAQVLLSANEFMYIR